MKIYLVSRTDNIGYDEYDAWVIAAQSPERAKKLSGYPADRLEVQYVGVASYRVKAGTILGSFNAG